MDRGTKRKAPATSTPRTDARAAKRQRTPGDPYYVPATSETPETTSEVGWKFVKQLKSAKDKIGRLVCTAFESLPDRKQFPEYYEQILLPIAIDTLEGKLERNKYANLAGLESDVKRLVTNAKTFNENTSQIYQDAERIRKMTSNFMVKHNPAYQDKDYVAFPTPLPNELEESEQEKQADCATTVTKPTPAPWASAEPASEVSEQGGEEENAVEGSYKGRTFQQAQAQIIKELMVYQDPESELEIFFPFVNLPPRTLTSYYATIKNPVSLKAILKQVNGQLGRQKGTGQTEFRTWDSLEAESSRIWENARIYNEDGSDIFELSIQLEEMFKEKLAQAKQEVDEPAQPTLKLNLGAKPPPIKIRLGATSKASPVPQRQNSGTPGVSVDQDALQRQKQMVQAGMNGVNGANVSRQPPNTAMQNPPAPTSAPLSPKRSKSGTGQSPTPTTNSVTNLVKTETKTTPAVGAVTGAVPNTAGVPSAPQPTLQPSMPPPPGPVQGMANGTPQSLMPVPQHIPYNFPMSGLDNKWRAEGKDATSALLTNLTISTHPDLRISRPLRIQIPANDTLAQQSATITVPPAHTSIRIQPTLHPSLVALGNFASTIPNASNSAAPLRPYKLFVTANNARVQGVAAPVLLTPSFTPTTSTPAPATAVPTPSSMSSPNQLTQTHTQTYSHLQTQTHPPKTTTVYDIKLQPGVNRIEIEVVSAVPVSVMKQQVPSHNTRHAASAGGLELERLSLFVHLARWPVG